MREKIVEYAKHYVKLYALPVLLCMAIVFVTGSLWTFNPHDLSLLYHARYGTCHNMFGYLGASVAAILIYLFGNGAYVFLGFLLYCLIFVLKLKSFKEEDDRVVGMLLLTVSSSMLCNLYQAGFYEFSTFGGVVGHVSVSALSFFDSYAQMLLVYSLLMISLVLVMRYSHLLVARWVLRAVEVVLFYLVDVDHMPARFIRATGSAVAKACFAVQRAGKYVWKLLDGTAVQQSSGSIVEFERDLPATQNVDRLMQDMFGHKPQVGSKHKVTVEDTSVDSMKVDTINVDDVPVETIHVEKNVTPVTGQDSEQHETVASGSYELPDIDTMLSYGDMYGKDDYEIDQSTLDSQAAVLEEKLALFNVKGKVVRVHPGPVITLFEYKPENHIKLSKITGFEDDLAMALQALSIRILAPIPGKDVVGFEVANKVRTPVLLANIFHSREWTHFDGSLPLILGEDTHGKHMVVDLASMPHVLIAGSTGSGKSVAVNCMLISLLCAKDPDEVRLIIIDPKQLEFSGYEDIAHLLFPIITDAKKAVPVLRWLVSTMEERYALMSECGVKNIFEYKKLAAKDPSLEQMPFIVLIIDELADLMMTTGKDAEDLIARLAQMSRAAGIHMIVATQRPSVDVITGLIKVNFPNRISFKVTSKVDSRTILDEMGAERLLGKGDMLFIDSKSPGIQRVHGAYVSEREIQFLVNHIRQQRKASYLDISEIFAKETDSTILEADQELFDDIVQMLKDEDEVSISMIQRRFRIGYNRSARIMEALEAKGHILPSDGGKMRRVVKE